MLLGVLFVVNISHQHERRESGCQIVTIDPNIYVMGSQSGSTLTSSVEMFEMSLCSLYPINDTYVTVEGGYCSPKLFVNLYID